MRVDVSRVLLDLDGEPVRQELPPERLMALFHETIRDLPEDLRRPLVERLNKASPALTVRSIILRAVGSSLQGLKPEEIGELYCVASRLPKEGEADLDVAAADLLRRAIEKINNQPVIVGQMREILSGRASPAAPAPVE